MGGQSNCLQWRPAHWGSHSPPFSNPMPCAQFLKQVHQATRFSMWYSRSGLQAMKTQANPPHVEVKGQLAMSPVALCFPRAACSFNPLAGSPAVGLQTGLLHGGQGETKEVAGHSRLVGDRFSKQGTLLRRLVPAAARRLALHTLPEES